MRLRRKSAVITGSSRGIGEAIAEVFAAEGAAVIVNCHQDPEEGARVVDRIRHAGGKAEICMADVRSPEDSEKLVQSAIKSYGKIDTKVNNAGIVRDSMMEKISAKIPLKRFGDPKEIAYAAVFLSSDECRYMTGQVLSVNGGLHL